MSDNIKAEKKSKNKFFRVVAACLSLPMSMMLGGCMDMYQEGTINENPIQVRQEAVFEDLPYNDLTPAYLDGLAAQLRKHADGPVDALITYDPKSKTNTAMYASRKAADLASALRKRGVEDVVAGILPVKGEGEQARVLLNYTAYSAHAPKGCTGKIPGLHGTAVEDNADYKYGCSVKTLMAKQVARPSDLAGKQNSDTYTDGRAASNIVDVYRSGAPSESLNGENASDSGN